MKNYNKVMLILAIAWMAVIFMFSAKPDVESQEMSGSVSYRLISVVDKAFGMNWDKEGKAEAIDYPVRKVAHMSEFAFLCLLVYGSFCWIDGKKRYVLPVAWVFAYACSDEFHQLFVKGRAGKFSDVLIDTSGALIMMLIILAVSRILKYNRRHR